MVSDSWVMNIKHELENKGLHVTYLWMNLVKITLPYAIYTHFFVEKCLIF
jgi:hypothetical protein